MLVSLGSLSPVSVHVCGVLVFLGHQAWWVCPVGRLATPLEEEHTHSAAVTTLDGWPQILKLIHIHYLYSFYRPLQFHRCHSRIHCILPCLYSLSLLFSTEPSVLSYDIWFLDGGTDKNIQLHLLIISGFCDLSLM